MLKFYFSLCLSLIILPGIAQTNPSPQSLPYSQNFSAFNGSSTTYPAGIQGWGFGSTATSTSYPTIAPTADQAIANGAAAQNSATSAFVGDAVTKMAFLSTGTNMKAIALALNTTAATGIQVSYLAATQRQQLANRVGAIGLQYRIGTSGAFTNISSTDYQNPGTSDNITGTGSINPQTISVTLPAACENQPILQLRWVYKEVSGSGNRPGFSITNIVVSVPTPCTTPTAQPTALIFGTITDVSIAGSFAAAVPSANEYLVVMSNNNSLTSGPVDGIIYNPGDALGDGTVLTRGNTLNFTATGLNASTTYYFFVFSLNSTCTGGPKYLSTGPLTNNATTAAGLPPCTTPAAQPSALVFGTTSINSIQGSFTATTANEYLVLRSTSSSLTNNPVNGTIYNTDDVLGNAIVVKRNGTTSFTANGLSPNTTYYFYIFSLNSQSCINGPVYNTISPLTGSQATLPLPACSTPLSQPTNLLLTPANIAISGSFNPGTGTDDYLTVISTSPSLSSLPVDNTDYAVGANLGGGTVVANSASTSFTASALSPNTTYYFFIFSANKNCTGGTKYLTVSPLTGNATTTSAPVNNYYFGTWHSHSSYSDGNKDNLTLTPVDDYNYAIVSQCMDYLGISEHNHFSSPGNPGNHVGTYHTGISTANSFTASHPNFVAMYGMEWGVISGGGHVVVYGDGMDNLFGWESGSGGWGPTNNYDVYVAKNDYTGASGLFKTVNDNIATNTFASLAHPQSGDYNNIAGTTYNNIAGTAISACAVESGPAFSTNTTYSDPASPMSYLSYFQKLLTIGYHLGPTIDHDNHNTTFGRATYSRTAVIAPSLSKTELIKAMRNMHFYATQDCDTKVDYTINAKIMGSVFTDRYAPIISVNLTDATTALTGAVIKVMYGVPGNGITATQIYSVTGSTLNYTDNSLANLSTGYYYIDITNGSSRIITAPIWYTRNDNFVVPVKMSNFLVQKMNNIVKLNWITEQEINSEYFEIERSSNGINWFPIERINASGFSSNRKDYTAFDNSPLNGINYYRLKQADRDSRFEYSAVKSVLFSSQYHVIIAPNPAKDYINILLSRNNIVQSVIVDIIDANGKKVYEEKTNLSSIQINTSRFSKGLYFVKLIDGDKLIINKIMVQ